MAVRTRLLCQAKKPGTATGYGLLFSYERSIRIPSRHPRLARRELPSWRPWSGPNAMGQPQGHTRDRHRPVARAHGRTRLDSAHLAQGLRRRGARPCAVSHPHRGAQGDRCTHAADGPRRQLHRAHDLRARHRRSEIALAARHRPGRWRLGHGLLRTGRRLRPREPLLPRRARGRRLHHQRPQDMDLRCHGLRLHIRARAHEP